MPHIALLLTTEKGFLFLFFVFCFVFISFLGKTIAIGKVLKLVPEKD